ncbi:F-box only 44 isoform X1 [Brachionus plicatilis]|uniref:F-box only 44 isoform X1 n=1 Tax=Brachionus plicatilis TaxID=10195 RepID=A0A3M7SE44_BRAPC|nr:F-box only 44 isoform X1 [Brachionus plicatilis]
MFSTFRRIFSAEKRKVGPECQAVPTDCLNINDLPSEILSLIFLNISGESLCKNVILTCKKWKEIIDLPPFWINKILHESRASKKLLKFLAESDNLQPKQLFFKNPFVKNLIKNACAEKGYDFWDNRSFLEIPNTHSHNLFDYYHNEYLKKYCRNSEKIQEQNGFIIEPDDYLDRPAFESDGKPVRNYATTYYRCTKYQLIDLYAEGIDENMLKKTKPKIEIKDWYAPRHDCGSEYHLRVVLYDQKYNEIKNVSCDEVFGQWSEVFWREFKEIIKEYPDSLRLI